MKINTEFIHNEVSFEQMLLHPRPHYLVTMDLWAEWSMKLKLSSIAFLKISDFAEKFGLIWHIDESDNLLSEYLFTDLLDLFEIEDVDKKRTLFLAFSFAVECLEKSYYKGIPSISEIEFPLYGDEKNRIFETPKYLASNRDILQLEIDRKPLIISQYSDDYDEEYVSLLVEELKELWLEYDDFAMQVNYPAKGKSYTSYPFEELDDGLAKLIILNYCHSSYPDISDLEDFLFSVYNYWIDRSDLVRESRSFYSFLAAIVSEYSYIENIYPYMVYDLLPHYSDEDPDDLINFKDKGYYEKYSTVISYNEGTQDVDFSILLDKYKSNPNSQGGSAVKSDVITDMGLVDISEINIPFDPSEQDLNLNLIPEENKDIDNFSKEIDILTMKCNTNNVEVKFEDLFKSDNPIDLITAEIWDDWRTIVIKHDEKIRYISDMVDELGSLYWQARWKYEKLSEYYLFSLDDIREIKFRGKNRTIVICMAKVATDVLDIKNLNTSQPRVIDYQYIESEVANVITSDYSESSGNISASAPVDNKSIFYDRPARGTLVILDDLKLDPVSHQVWRSGLEIELTQKEYGLLLYLMRNPNMVLSRKEINDNAFENAADSSTNILDVYFNYLRKKVDNDFHTKLIHTVRGEGYILRTLSGECASCIEVATGAEFSENHADLGRGAVICFDDLKLDPVSHWVWRAEQRIEVTQKEYSLLLYFMRNPGVVISREMINDNVFEGVVDRSSNIIDVYVNYLRNKLDRDFTVKLIHTVRGEGYILQNRETSLDKENSEIYVAQEQKEVFQPEMFELKAVSEPRSSFNAPSHDDCDELFLLMDEDDTIILS